MGWDITSEELLERYDAGERNFAGINLVRHKVGSLDSKISDYFGGGGIDLNDVVLRDINLRGAYFYKVCLVGADLSGADLGGIFLEECSLEKATVRNASLVSAHFSECVFTQADFSMSCFNSCIINYCWFNDAVMKEVFIERTILIDAHFSGAKFTKFGRDNSFWHRDESLGNYISGITLPNNQCIDA